MASKLPKPKGLKPPQFGSLATLSEASRFNLINNCREPIAKAQEAPSVSCNMLKSMGPSLRRRSKSVSDLRTLSRKPVLDFKTIKTQNQTQIRFNKNKPNNVAPKVDKPPFGIKRSATSSADGASKPKMVKKIPDWDFKSRFQQLSERHQAVQEELKISKAKIEYFDELNSKYAEAQSDLTQLRADNEKMLLKCSTFDQVKTELQNLQDKYRELEIKHDKSVEEIIGLRRDNEILTKKLQSIKDDLTQAQQDICSLQTTVSLQKSDIVSFESERRVLHNKIQDLKGNIRVFCRVRPPLQSEAEKLQCHIDFMYDNEIAISKSRESTDQITGKAQNVLLEFAYDKVFPPCSVQGEIFEELSQLVQSALDGYNVCIFAYGQTGSGKTYTMQGGEDEAQGMIPRTSQFIFEVIEKMKRSGWRYTVEASFLEIYNENVRDLSNLYGTKKLDICFNEGKGTTVTNLVRQPIGSAEELKNYIALAHKSRATAATHFNECSSRSHAITKIYLQGVNEELNLLYTGSINLIDLAGSESAKQSVAGQRLNETKNINKSLATLGNVIGALHNKAKHIPYRNSKLTYLLQSCLGGNSKTLMIVNIAPFEDCFGESVNSLRFAAKVKEVKTASRRNKKLGE